MHEYMDVCETVPYKHVFERIACHKMIEFLLLLMALMFTYLLPENNFVKTEMMNSSNKAKPQMFMKAYYRTLQQYVCICPSSFARLVYIAHIRTMYLQSQ